MDKETLSNYGWIVICVLVLAVMIALATPFGNFISDAVKSTTKGLFDVNKSALNSTGLINIGDQSFENTGNVDSETPTHDHNAPELHPTTTQADSFYGNTNIGVYDSMPETPALYDFYRHGDYLYIYHVDDTDDRYSGWVVYSATEYSQFVDMLQYLGSVTSASKETYAPMLESIAGEPVVGINDPFKGCVNLKASPIIPQGIKVICGAYEGCTSLTTAPTIPNGVLEMTGTFKDCTALAKAPVLPNGIDNINGLFEGCTSLTTAPKIPDSVISMDGTFEGCTELKTAPVIPNNVENIAFAFAGCTALETAPVIPHGVTSIWSAFKNCTSLKTAPTIPSSVTRVEAAFWGCTALETAPEIPDGVTTIESMFRDCTSLKAAPKIPDSVTVMRYAFQGCTALETASDIPSGVKNISGAFNGCTALRGTITINTSKATSTTYYSNCFNGIDFDIQNITLVGTSTNIDTIGATGTNYCADCNGTCTGHN